VCLAHRIGQGVRPVDDFAALKIMSGCQPLNLIEPVTANPLQRISF
jgi:hypothetical protein